MSTPSIDALFDEAINAARLSPNRQRKVGAVLVLRDSGSTIVACNTYPAGVRHAPERADGAGRFVWLEHAERNALFQAARRGLATEGAILVSTYFPCADCGRAVVQSGVRTVYCPRPRFDDPVWGDSFRDSAVILAEGGVEVGFLPADQEEVHALIWEGVSPLPAA